MAKQQNPEQENFNLSKPFIGLDQDSVIQEQPKGSYRFALNAVNESLEGESKSLSNEESNQRVVDIPVNYVVLGKCIYRR